VFRGTGIPPVVRFVIVEDEPDDIVWVLPIEGPLFLGIDYVVWRSDYLG